MASRINPLPLDETLRDLALIRACDIDLFGLVPKTRSPSQSTKDGDESPSDARASVERSYEFVKQARAALKILSREDVEKQGNKIEGVRNVLEDTLKGVQSAMA